MMNCADYENLVDDFFSHQLDRKEKKQIQRHLHACKNCRGYYQQYKEMLDSLNAMSVKKCPENVVDNVMDILNIDSGQEENESLLESIRNFFGRYRWRSGVTGIAAAVVLALMLLYPVTMQQKQTTHQYTEKEIEEAKDQVKIALAYFNKVTNQTQEILEQKVLPEQVVKPMKSSIKTAIKPFFNGGES